MHLSLSFLNPRHTLTNNAIFYHVSRDKAEGRDIAPSINSEERPDLENYKSKYKGSSSTSNTVKTTDYDSVTTVPTPEGILKQDSYRG